MIIFDSVSSHKAKSEKKNKKSSWLIKWIYNAAFIEERGFSFNKQPWHMKNSIIAIVCGQNKQG